MMAKAARIAPRWSHNLHPVYVVVMPAKPGRPRPLATKPDGTPLMFASARTANAWAVSQGLDVERSEALEQEQEQGHDEPDNPDGLSAGRGIFLGIAAGISLWALVLGGWWVFNRAIGS